MPVLLVYLGVFAAMLIIGAICWSISRASRHSRRCTQCGERVIVEQMEAAHCPCCGADLGPKEQP